MPAVPIPMGVPTESGVKILKFVNRYRIRYGNPPAVREIGEHLHIGNATVHHHLMRLIDDGMLSHRAGIARSLRLTQSGRDALLLYDDGGPKATTGDLEALEDMGRESVLEDADEAETVTPTVFDRR